MFQVKVITSLREIDSLILNEMSDDVFYYYDWLSFVEHPDLFNVFPRYIIVLQGNELVALVPCFIETSGSRWSLERDILGRIQKVSNLVGVSLRPVLMCYSLPYSPSKILIKPEFQARTSAILQLVLKEIDQICLRERIPLSAFLHHSKNNDFLIGDLVGHQYAKFPALPDTCIELNYEDFEGYLSSLGASARRNVRREMRKNREKGVKIKVYQGEEIESIASLLYSLHRNVCAHYGQKFGLFSAQFFQEIGQYLGSKAWVYAAWKDDRMIGFSLYLRRGQTARAYVTGLDYGENRGSFTYFNVNYYAPLERLIKEGIKRAYWGTTVYAAKVERGASLQPRWLYLKIHPGGGNVLTRTLVEAHGKWLTRKFRRSDWYHLLP